ncbi:magnesium transporter [Bacillus badius]|uniref:Magnesium transporter MgtE n=1 Tax=Bacillus badius TaxID=1455 RepID=A0ABR5AUN5_BACBA|nr:magnesium transporter [Bacillus badius]KIL72908.1 Mg/Co/Ni transporter MgtE [Bacillus badius]KIL78076.1 Mg/Co/Ni transporter MgtE [Bacillus badius]KZR57117.1 magnesium transporter [Bacillus badius]MED4717117.1 magnesium transporter [Bacillus badius]
MLTNLTEDQMTLLVIKALKEGKKKELQKLLDELHPYDMAAIYTNLPPKHQTRFLLQLSIPILTDMIQELDNENQLDVLKKVGKERSRKVLDDMDNDDLASLLDDMSPEKIKLFLAGMKKEESTIIESMMAYPAETAGRLMTNRFVWIRDTYTVREAVDKLKTFAEFAETINYLYVIDAQKKLVGVVSYRDLLLADANDKVNEVMYGRVISVSVYTDQEEVARLIERYDFLAIPVVDDHDMLVGIVTFDDIIDVVIQEANEDIEKLSASGKSIDFDTKASTAAFRRLPWLILLLFIGLVSGSIISGFENTLQQVVALTFFMPMISGMTGNTGTQSLAVVVRGLASRDIDMKTVLSLIGREFGVGFIIGIVCAVLIFLIAFFWQGSAILGIVVSSSLLITLIIGTLAGTVIPLVLYKLNIDPAVASGPLITTINDIFSLIIYFSIASWFLQQLM